MQAKAPEVNLATTTDIAVLVEAAFKWVNAREYDAARPLMERALALDANSGVSAHVKAHLTSESGAVAEGAAYLRSFFAREDPFLGINVHNAWHLAALELDLARPAAALAWHVRVVAPTVARYTFFSAAALLWCLELYGYGAALRAQGRQLPWDEARAAALRLTDAPDDSGESRMNDIGRAMTFIATRDEQNLAGLLDRLRGAGTGARENTGAAEVVLPFVLGLRAFWHGDYAAALDLIAPDMPARVTSAPNQVSVLEDTLIEAQLRAGRFAEAEASVHRRLSTIKLPRYRYWLGRAQHGLGRRAEAAANLRAARDAWRDAEPDSPEILALEALLAPT